jgi:hypothetical protein
VYGAKSKVAIGNPNKLGIFPKFNIYLQGERIKLWANSKWLQAQPRDDGRSARRPSTDDGRCAARRNLMRYLNLGETDQNKTLWLDRVPLVAHGWLETLSDVIGHGHILQCRQIFNLYHPLSKYILSSSTSPPPQSLSSSHSHGYGRSPCSLVLESQLFKPQVHKKGPLFSARALGASLCATNLLGRPANYPGRTRTHTVSTIYASHHVRRPDAETGCSSHVKRAARVKSSVTALNQCAQIVLRRLLLLDQAISIYYQRMSATSWPMVFACTINYPNVVVLTVSPVRGSERGHELMTPVTSVSHAVEVTLI